MSKVHCLSFLSFIQKIHKRPTYHWSKTTESGGKSHCEIKAFSSSCWPQLLQRPFSQDNSSEFSPVMPEEFGEHLIRDQRPFLHPESLQILQIHSSMLVLLLLSSPHSCSVGFRSEHWDSHGKRFNLCSATHFCVCLDCCPGGRSKHGSLQDLLQRQSGFDFVSVGIW